MKVYLVFSGEYSDKSCEAVFDNLKDAEDYQKLLEEQRSACIEEFVVNEIKPVNYKYIPHYSAWIYIKDYMDKKKGDIDTYSEFGLTDITQPTIISKGYNRIYVQSIISMEHAKKVAIEQYQIYTQQQFENGTDA
jgi:hypothetical protein